MKHSNPHPVSIGKLREQLEANPKNIGLLNQLGIALCKIAWKDQALWEELHREAISLFRKASKLDPRNTIVLTNLGCALADSGNHSAAFRILKKGEEIGSEDSHLFFNIAVAMMNLNARSRVRARDYFDRASNLHPRDDTMKAYFDYHAH